MSDRLPRSNSQSHLPNYGQGQSDDKNKDVDKKKDGAPSQSDKNTGQGHSDKNKAAPQLKSREEKKEKGASAAARKLVDSDESPSEDGAAQSKSKTLTSPRQKQSDNKEETANNKVPKLFLKNLGNAIASFASDRREMVISPRKKKEKRIQIRRIQIPALVLQPKAEERLLQKRLPPRERK